MMATSHGSFKGGSIERHDHRPPNTAQTFYAGIGLQLEAIRPSTVAAYIEQLGVGMAKALGQAAPGGHSSAIRLLALGFLFYPGMISPSNIWRAEFTTQGLPEPGMPSSTAMRAPP
jgi:hypothetical protein